VHTLIFRTSIGGIAGAIFLALALTASLSAAEPLVKKPLLEKPLLEKIDVFQAKTGGYMLYRIPGIVVTAKGTALAPPWRDWSRS
jgi:hypothetical protein